MSRSIISLILLFTLLSCISGHAFTNCGSKTDPLKIISFDLSPDAPVSGQNLNITASAILNESITAGTYSLTVNYIGIPVLTETDNLCNFLTCPTQANKVLSGSKSVIIPSNAPYGSYSGTVQFNDENNNKLGCIGFTLNI